MKISASEKAAQAVLGAVMSVFVLVTMYPLIHVFFAAISDPKRLTVHRGLMFYPLGFSLQAFEMLFRNQFIVSGLFNSFFLVVAGVAVNIFMTALAAYVLSKRYARLVKAFTMFIIFTMLFNGGLIPMYLLVKGMGLYNNYLSLILPFAINTFNLIILRSAFEGVPASLDESARMDGANHLTILFRITIPLVMPMIAVIMLYYAIDRWNGWFYASIFIKDKEKFPLQLILRNLLIDNDSSSMMDGNYLGDMAMLAESIKYAAIVVGTVPVLVLFPFLQRYFIRGNLEGAIKE